jgi:two-component system cell cycle sensor histidine kinase/response regulator CckA
MLKEHELVLAQGGAEGLEALRREPAFDLILSDLMMPDLDGPVLYSELQRLRPELLCRLVFCSGGASTERARQFLDSIDNPVLDKPLTREAFERAARHVLQGSAKVSGIRPAYGGGIDDTRRVK